MVPVFVFGVFLSVATVLFLLPLSFWGLAQALAGTPWCVCSACPGAPAVFPLCVMQLATLLGFHTWLTQVGCPTSAVTVSRGVGVVLVQMSCYPLVLIPCASASLVAWVRLQPFLFFFWASPTPLPCWGSWGFAPCVRVLQWRCVLLGLQVGFPGCLSLTLEWVYFWPKVSQVVVGCEGSLSCSSWFVIFFLCLLVLHLFWGWGGLITGRWPLLRLLVLDSSDARLHRPDALASVCYASPISGSWMVLTPALSWAFP